jgi:hypothetical protein
VTKALWKRVEIAETLLLEFPKHQDFAIHGIEVGDGTADPQSRFGSVLPGGIVRGAALAQKCGAE